MHSSALNSATGNRADNNGQKIGKDEESDGKAAALSKDYSIELEHNKEQLTEIISLSCSGSNMARKPEICRMGPPSALFARLNQFLPLMKESTDKLVAQRTECGDSEGSGFELISAGEEEDEEEGMSFFQPSIGENESITSSSEETEDETSHIPSNPMIEMSLGLGVFDLAPNVDIDALAMRHKLPTTTSSASPSVLKTASNGPDIIISPSMSMREGGIEVLASSDETQKFAEGLSDTGR